MLLRRFGLLLAFLPASLPAFGQVVDLDKSRVQMTELTGPWRFHTGDAPAWAQPGFDDSGWSLLRADRSWAEQGYEGSTGVAWYRLLITIPTAHGPLALYLPNVEESCQVFANGRLIGQIGDLPPLPKFVVARRVLFAIPNDALSPVRPLQIAIRVWHRPAFARYRMGGIHPPPYIGDASAMAEWQRLQNRDAYWASSGSYVEAFGNILTALAGLGLFALRRREREYLWFGVSQFFWAAANVTSLYGNARPVPYFEFVLFANCVYALATYFQVEFYVSLLGERRGRLYWSAVFLLVFNAFAKLGFSVSPGPFFQLASLAAALCFTACIWMMLYRGARRGNPDAPVLLVPLAILFVLNILAFTANLPVLSGVSWLQSAWGFMLQPIRRPFPMNAFVIVGQLQMYAVLVILVRRYARSRQDEERMEAELEAARVVQKVLIPDEIPAIAGFDVQTVYKPAGQVGGDFFQIITHGSNGALIVIGDVSGKGMPAAMTVSLLVGTVRTLAHFTRNPAEILRAMNQRMLARSKNGFTTCLVLRLDSDGTLTIANAGHIAPYTGGREVPVENGLPLGLEAAAVYTETTLRLGSDETLTLLTDGVVEARNAAGELFGFERTAAIVGQDAESIARAAQQFGQEDDITVLSIRRRASNEERRFADEPAAWSPAPA